MTNRINEEKDQERTIKSEASTPRTRILTEGMDESDNEIFIEELTSKELATGYSEMSVINGELSKRLTMYENAYALLQEERVKLIMNIVDLEGEVQDAKRGKKAKQEAQHTPISAKRCYQCGKIGHLRFTCTET